MFSVFKLKEFGEQNAYSLKKKKHFLIRIHNGIFDLDSTPSF